MMTVSSTVRSVTAHDATGPSPAVIGPHDASRHAGQVVRRVLLRRNVVIDAETVQLVAGAVQAVRHPGTDPTLIRLCAPGLVIVDLRRLTIPYCCPGCSKTWR
jgi:hypothetical protein